jgi:hypothetical protein
MLKHGEPQFCKENPNSIFGDEESTSVACFIDSITLVAQQHHCLWFRFFWKSPVRRQLL